MSTTDRGHYWDDDLRKELRIRSLEVLYDKCYDLKKQDADCDFIARLFETWMEDVLYCPIISSDTAE